MKNLWAASQVSRWHKTAIAPLLILTVFLGQFLLLFQLIGPGWDAVFYYAYARSVVFDRDLDLVNDLTLSYDTAGADFVAKALHTQLTESGRVENPFAIGASLLWLPLVAALYFGGQILQYSGLIAGGWHGYEWFFWGSVSLFSALSGLAAFWLSYRVAERETGHVSATLATMTLMLATPLLYYQFREPMYSHTASALTAALCVYVWWRDREKPLAMRSALLLGALIGLAALVRWQNVMYLALPFTSALYDWLNRSPVERRRTWWPVLRYGLVIGITAVFVFSLQMAVWRLFYGSWITVPQGDSFMNWRATFIWPVLFSTFHGLLTWMPVFFLAVVGLVGLAWKRPSLALPLIIVLLLELYINSSTGDWFAAGGFGPRRFTSELPILLLGYAAFLQMWPHRVRLVGGAGLGILLAVHNWALLRHALREGIGGRVRSMAPNFEWVDESYAEFWGAMLNRMGNAVRQPLDFWVLPGSPAALLLARSGDFWRIVAVVGMVVVFAAALAFASWLIWRRGRKTAVFLPILFIMLALAILSANLWILFVA